MPTITVFIILYLIIFVVYASIYSSEMQEINKSLRLLNVKNINQEKLKNTIDRRERKVSKLKRIIWIPLTALLVGHLITVQRLEFPTNLDYLIALILFSAAILLIGIITWMKGAGTIDKNQRMGRSPWM